MGIEYFFESLFHVEIFLKNDIIKCSGLKILYGTWRLYSIGIKTKNTTSEVSIILIQIHRKKKNFKITFNELCWLKSHKSLKI